MTSFLPIEGEVNCPEGTKNCSPGMRNSIIFAAINEGGIDNALVNALGSISTKPDRSKALAMSHEQKSKRILQHCSSWTQLDDTRANRGIIHGQGEQMLNSYVYRMFFFITHMRVISFSSFNGDSRWG